MIKNIITLCLISVLFIQADLNKNEGLDKKWELVKIENIKGGDVFDQNNFPFEKAFTMEIKEGKMSYSLICNNCFQSFETVSEATVKIGMSGCTRAFCEGEDEYWKVLQFDKCTTYSFDDENDQLELRSEAFKYTFRELDEE